MKKILQQQKEYIFETMLKREVSKRWLEKDIAATPEVIKNLDKEKATDEDKKKFELYQKQSETLVSMQKAEAGDIFAYHILDKCYQTVNNLLK